MAGLRQFISRLTRLWYSLHLYWRSSSVVTSRIRHEAATRAVVRLKRLLDRHRWSRFRNELEGYWYKPMPEHFVRALFPHLSQTGNDPTTQLLVDVDPGLVVGFDEVHIVGNGIPTNPGRERDPIGFCDELDDQTYRNTTRSAEGYRANPLELHWLYEGLTRPSLSATLNRLLPIRINLETFPDFDKAYIEEVSGLLRSAYRLHAGGKWAVVIMPRFVVPMLTSSGVPVAVTRGSIALQAKLHLKGLLRLHRLYVRPFLR
ncbi:hypothetical protein J2Z50_004008 [Ensifer mexicanus]|nr:hypothetical protein [Sinorhizobium mexicanum]